jgi:hypothetical protein
MPTSPDILARSKAYYLANKKRIRIRHAQYYLKNQKRIQQWRIDNKIKLNLISKNYRITHLKQCLKTSKIWRENNRLRHRKMINICYQKRLQTDMHFKIRCNLRIRLNKALRGNYKVGSAVKNLGCSIKQLKDYLTARFQNGMTWDNYGKVGWHIDHIRPLSSFNLNNKKDFLQACHYSNLQPLWAKDNLSKGAKI